MVTVYVESQGKIWEARKVREGYRLRHPVPASLASKESLDSFAAKIRRSVVQNKGP